MLQTPEFKYPVTLTEEYRYGELQKRITLQGNAGDSYTSKWFWNKQSVEEREMKKALEEVESNINSVAHMGIRQGLMELNREREIKRRINKLF